MRPAQNGFTAATVPFILQSPPNTRRTDLMQGFVQDPQGGLPTLPGLSFGPILPFGRDSTSKLPLPPSPTPVAPPP